MIKRLLFLTILLFGQASLFGEWRSFEDIGEWSYDDSEDTSKQTDRSNTRVSMDILIKINDEVNSTMTYTAMPKNKLGGEIVFSPEEVDKNRLGDCSEYSMLRGQLAINKYNISPSKIKIASLRDIDNTKIGHAVTIIDGIVLDYEIYNSIDKYLLEKKEYSKNNIRMFTWEEYLLYVKYHNKDQTFTIKIVKSLHK